MILIDERAGSRELIPLIPDCVPCLLPSGDVCIDGNGPDGPVLVGVEVKTLDDLFKSNATGRLAATQLPNLLDSYYQAWILIIGSHRLGTRDRLEIRGSRGVWFPYRIGGRDVPYGYLEALLVELQTVGCLVKQVRDYHTASQWLGVLARWWGKEWSGHKGLHKFDTTASNKRGVIQDRTQPNWETEDQIARVVSQFPGLGWDRAQAAARYFGSVEEMIYSDVDEWAQIKGIGKVLAKTTVNAIRRKKDGQSD